MGVDERPRSNLHGTTLPERLGKDIMRHPNVVRVFPNREALVRLAGTLMLVQNDEGAVFRSHVPVGELMGVSDDINMAIIISAQ